MCERVFVLKTENTKRLKISFDKTDKTQGVVKISIKKADYQPGVVQKIKEYGRTATIKGFRKGRVPPWMIRKMYGTALIVDEINKLVSDRLHSYLREDETQFVGEPMPEKPDESYDWENQDEFEFNYHIGYAHPFDLKLDKKIKVKKYAVKVNDAVIDETIENLRRRFGDLEHPDTVSDGDTIYGQVASTESDLDQETSIDLRDVEKSALKKLIGTKLGDEIQLDLKTLFKNENAVRNQWRMSDEDFKKTKKISFLVQGINHYKLATIDQNLFDQSFGKDAVKNEEEFRATVKEVAVKNYATESEKFFDRQLIEKLTEIAKIELPDTFLRKWLQQTNESVTEEFLQSVYSFYAQKLRWSLIRDKVLKDQGLQVSHEDVVNEAKDFVKQQFSDHDLPEINDQLDTFVNNYLQGDNYMNVFNKVQEKKALENIKGQVSINENEVTLDEFRKLQT